ncbi:MAG: DNA glycosylase, partial [Trebouxia sp. A1-2]
MAMSGRAPGITHPAAATDQPASPAADANMHRQPQASGQSTLAGAACRAGGSDLQNSMPVACSLGGADVGSSMLTGTTGSPAGVGICSAGLNCTAGIASTAGKAGAPCPNHGSHEQQSRGKGSMSRACSPDSCVKDGLAYVALLVPCRKAMRNQFPLNGTFFQVNEVFLDQATITQPLQVPEATMKGWRRRRVYSGVQAASICRGMRQGEVAYLFNQACICVRAYNSTTGMPSALPAWLLPSSAQPPKPKRASRDKADAPIHKKAKGSPGMRATAAADFAIGQHESEPPPSKAHPAAPGSTQVVFNKLMGSISNQKSPEVSPVHVSPALQGHMVVVEAQHQLTAQLKTKQLLGLPPETGLKSTGTSGNTKPRK